MTVYVELMPIKDEGYCVKVDTDKKECRLLYGSCTAVWVDLNSHEYKILMPENEYTVETGTHEGQFSFDIHEQGELIASVSVE